MRRVAMISEHASPVATMGSTDCGGQNVYVDQVSRGLARLGWQVDVYTRADGPDLQPIAWADGVRIIPVPAGPLAPIPKDDIWPLIHEFLRSMEELTARYGPYDLIHGNFWMSGWLGAKLKPRLGIPFVQMFHALGAVKRRHQGEADTSPPDRLAAEQTVIEAADVILAQCPSEYAELVELYAADPHRIRIVPSGVDLERFAPVPKAEARRTLGLSPDERIAVYVGRLLPRKDVANVIEALGRLYQPDLVPNQAQSAELGRGSPPWLPSGWGRAGAARGQSRDPEGSHGGLPLPGRSATAPSPKALAESGATPPGGGVGRTDSSVIPSRGKESPDRSLVANSSGDSSPRLGMTVNRNSPGQTLALDPSEGEALAALGRIGRERIGSDTPRAFAPLGRNYRLLVVGGETPDADLAKEPEMRRLVTLAERLGVRERVTFSGRRPADKLRWYYSAADVFVTTPWYEPYGLTPLEAMACGTPAVCSAVGGITYTVADGETGFLVPPRRPDLLADRLDFVLRDDQLRERLSRNARRRVEERFSWSVVAERTAAVFAELSRRTVA